jgi:flagellar biosynthesis chaperone FliJ
MLENSQKELKQEREFTKEYNDSRLNFARYVVVNLERQKTINYNLLRVGEEIEITREEIATALSELKKYEIIREVKLAEEEREAVKREQLILDEIGITAYIRRDKKEDTDVVY